MNELTNFEFIIVIMAILFCAYLFWTAEPKKDFRRGYQYAEQTFDHRTFKDAMEELQSFREESRVFNEYGDFERGIEHSINERVRMACDMFNTVEGGDWYFDYKSLSFKDTQTDREAVL